ncbi:MAG TPA: LytTR family DNA-binding domain-containing protein, partial [Hanamia sp.]|nr:LytTR family DNA-binding domain-containing protein [Hanamia sp.]
YERFLKTISKAKDKLFKKQIDQSINFEEDFYIKSETKGKMVKVKYNDVYYIEARANYLKIFLEKKSYITYLTMKELEEKLPPKKFIRVHKSFIINIQKVIALEANQILLENNVTVGIGRSYRTSLLSVINSRLISSKRMP